MKHAIEELRKAAQICGKEKLLIDTRAGYLKTAEFLEKGEKGSGFCLPRSAKRKLLEVLKSVENGLKYWPDSYPEQKQRQERRRAEVLAALQFLEENSSLEPVGQNSSINDIVDSLGIVRVGDSALNGEVFWEFGGVRISRPSFKACWKAVKDSFGIDCEWLKCDGYYQ